MHANQEEPEAAEEGEAEQIEEEQEHEQEEAELEIKEDDASKRSEPNRGDESMADVDAPSKDDVSQNNNEGDSKTVGKKRHTKPLERLESSRMARPSYDAEGVSS